MTYSTSNGAKISIGPANSVADDGAAYLALTYVLISGAEDIGEFGDESEIVPFIPLAYDRNMKLKGSRDAGDMALVVGLDVQDAGQLALIAAEQTNFQYAFKVELDDAYEAGGTNTIKYFRALVNSARDSVGAANNVNRTNYNLPITSKIVTVPAADAP
jgi:hypothetical protein